jgi:RNA polymerase sigma-70 factor, ECF subfamily
MPVSPDACHPARLAALARAGDVAALDALVRCQGARLLAVGRRHCRTVAEAEDAVQDALLAAGEHLDAYRGEAPLEAWVGRMVARACGRMRRGRKNDPALHAVDAEVVAPCVDPALSAELSRALGALSPADRVLLQLDAEGWTSPEIAEALGLSADAVRARLSRARKKLVTL